MLKKAPAPVPSIDGLLFRS